MGAVIYVRVSTDEQHLSPDAQIFECKAMAERKGLSVESIHVEKGVSGAAALHEREILMDAIYDLGKDDVLIISKRDRLARGVSQAIAAETLVKERGAVIMSADGLDHSDDPNAVLMRRIMDSFAEFELAKTKMRTRAALRQLRRNGKRAGTVPWGMLADEDGNLHVHREEAKVLKMVMRLRGAGVSYQKICDKVNAKGFVNRAGKPFVKMSIHKIYTGGLKILEAKDRVSLIIQEGLV